MNGDLFIVDDNADNLGVLARILRDAGHKVRLANSGRRALAAIARHPPELVLLDINMPEMSGYEVCEQLKADEATRDIPVIFLSALDDVRDKVIAFRAGAVDYVTKPFQAEEVLARVESQLRFLRLRRELERKNEELERGQRELLRAWEDADGIFAVLVNLLPGRVLDGRYRLEEKIGAGGFAAVYRAVDLGAGHDVAIKVLRPGVGGERARRRLRLESESALRVRHPNAVTVLDLVASEAGVAYLVMELLSGRSLASELAVAGPLSVVRCARVLAPVCAVLAEAHRAGVIHRDVKPDNIFLHRGAPDGAEVVKLVDFGIAHDTADATRGTTAGRVIGTPAYISPERLLGRAYDHRADIYSLAATAHELLAGAPPFVAGEEGLAAFMLRCATEPPPPLGAQRPDLPAPLEALIAAGLAKDPAPRPPLSDFAATFEAILAEDGVRRARTAAMITAEDGALAPPETSTRSDP